MLVSVFIEAEAGSREKGVYDEASFEFRGVRRTLLPYPYPYGFLPGTPGGEDGECLDCYVVTRRALERGRSYEAELVGLLEMREDGEEDHKLVARIPGEEADEGLPRGRALRDELAAFIRGIFRAFPEVRLELGPLLPAAAAEALAGSRSAYDQSLPPLEKRGPSPL